MNPCELNVIITAITNHFFQTLTKDEFACLGVFLNELSKSMFTTALFRDLCDKDKKKHDHDEKDHDNHNEHKK